MVTSVVAKSNERALVAASMMLQALAACSFSLLRDKQAMQRNH
jgi:hypothetical protein